MPPWTPKARLSRKCEAGSMATNQPCNQVSGCFYYCRRFLGDELVFTPVCSSRLCFRELCRQRFDRWEGYVCRHARSAVLQQTCQRYFPSLLSSRKGRFAVLQGGCHRRMPQCHHMTRVRSPSESALHRGLRSRTHFRRTLKFVIVICWQMAKACVQACSSRSSMLSRQIAP